METVFLVDGSGYIFRAYYAVRPLTSKTGVPTNAVYGFTSMLLKLLKEHKPTHIAVVFDRPEKTFRHAMYSEYKANRPPPPEDLVPQFALIRRMVDAFGIRRLDQAGYEADDIIGSLAKQVEAAGKKVVIVTGDKDLMQLVNQNTVLLDELRALNTGSEEMIDVEGVKKKFGVTPERVVDVLALAGDTSDNVPGVRGIGEKTAIELVQQYGTVESILNCASMMPQKSRREKLIGDSKMALLSKALVTIKCDIDVGLSADELRYQGPSHEALIALCDELNFKRLLQDPWILSRTTVEDAVAPEQILHKADSAIDTTVYKLINTPELLSELVGELRLSKRIAIDTETDGLDPQSAHCVGISLCWGPGEAVYIPIRHVLQMGEKQLALEEVCRALNPILQDNSKTIVAQNAKFDWAVLLNAGFSPFRMGGDPMLASYLLEAEDGRHNLDDMSRRYLDHEPITYESVCGTGKNKITFDHVPLDRAVAYAAEDAELAFLLANKLEKKLEEEKLSKLYTNMELPLEGVLARMECVGVQIDTGLLGEMSVEFAGTLVKLEAQAYETAGMQFNLASPKQVAEVLFGKMGLEPVKKTKTGQSTDAAVLEELAPLHPLPKVLLEHRMLSKLKGTYVDALPRLVNPRTGRVHTSYNQAVAATGRLSSSDPNLQNIPIRSTEGRRIREAFVAKAGCLLMSLDYSQIELRILAHVSKDPVMIDAFSKNEDVHQRTASEIFGVPLEQVSKEQRSYAKTINFGLMYGMGVHRLSQSLEISRAEASEYLKRYYERYSGVYAWQKHALEKAREQKEVRTLFGRLRKLPDLGSQNRMLVQRAERMATNTPIQGTAADLIKVAMIRADERLSKEMPDVKMILQVHDELVLEVPEQLVDKTRTLMQDTMSHVVDFSVPLVVDCGVGHSWAEAH